MTLDKLYEKIKNAKYPILDREELIRALGDINVDFEEEFFDSRDIGTMITQYPIEKPSHMIELFISAAQEEYEITDEQAEEFREIEE